MASRGFEFAYMLDGSGATPVIRDFIIGEGRHLVLALHGRFQVGGKLGELFVFALLLLLLEFRHNLTGEELQ